MEFLSQFIVLIVLGICICVGAILKHLVPSEKINNFIPLIMGALGVILNCWLNGWLFTPTILLGGLVSGLGSTGMYEMVDQLKEFVKEFLLKKGE